ncbi:MAG: hypothetical protein KF727_14420 [Microbacteriaceae bacterium]|nr:hypothetical protein [Microbacteriaceae bacterium]
MGGRRRPAVAAHFDALAIARQWAQVMADREPESLKPQELDLEHQPLTKPPRPLPVLVWVRYAAVPVRVAGIAVAWTDRATAVKWMTPHGDEHRAWVWSPAAADRPRFDGEDSPTLAAVERGRRALDLAVRA